MMSEPPTPNPGRDLAALRRRVTTPCIICGTPVMGTTKRRTCSAKCRAALYRQRKREQADAQQHGDEPPLATPGGTR